MYTITVCPDCEHVNTTKDHPERTSCDRCGKSHKFRNLRHYHQTDSREEAAHIRGMVAAKLQGHEDIFERAVENGLYEADEMNLFDEDEYLKARGANPAEVAEAGESATQSGPSKSQREAMEDAITEQEAPTEEDVLDYAEEWGVDREKASRLLEKMRRSGTIVESNDGVLKML